jgi:6-phosphogluconolactonase
LAITPSLGAGPQNLAITPDGGLLLCANMPGDNLVVFRIDRGTGSLAVVGEPLAVEGPACIQLIGRASFDARPAGVKPGP